MSVIAKQVEEYIEKSSWIRKMFEAGIELRAKYGEEAVCDFSLGNPDLPPPVKVAEALKGIACEADTPFAFGYMPNPGYGFAREALATHITREQGLLVDMEDIIVTCGAAGALNAVMRAVLNPGDEVLCPAPYFVEYGFYTQNHGGVFKTVPTKPLTFELDTEAIAAGITEKTRIVLLNSPNNPTGVVYSEESIQALVEVLQDKTTEFGRPVYLVADEPYRFLVFDNVQVPSVLQKYSWSLVVNSFSKSLSLAGERVGYIAVCPHMPEKKLLLAALTLSNRILGYVNAPAIGQKLMARVLDSQVDVAVYADRRLAMARVLDTAGYSYTMPRGTFYFFPKAPGGDDIAFVHALQQECILAVPGSGFGAPGYFRLTFCVDKTVIERSASGFARALQAVQP